MTDAAHTAHAAQAPGPEQLPDALARLYDLDLLDDPGDLDLWLALAEKAGGPILELMAGTGRLAVPLAEAGFAVTAVDLDPAMLRRAALRAAAADEDVQERLALVLGDVVGLELPGAATFRLAFVALNSMLLLRTREAQRAAWSALAAHLAPGGLAAIDAWLPDAADLARYDGRLHLETRGLGQDPLLVNGSQADDVAAKPSDGRLAQIALVEERREGHRSGCAIVLRGGRLRDPRAALRVSPQVFEVKSAVVPGEVRGVGQPSVDGSQAARGEVRGERRPGGLLGLARAKEQHRVEGHEGEPKRAGGGQLQAHDVAEHERKALLDVLVRSRRTERGPPEHRRVQVHGGDREARLGKRDRQTARPGHQLEDRAPGLLGQCEPEVQVPGVVQQVQVIEARKRVRELLRSGRLGRVGHARVGHARGVPWPAKQPLARAWSDAPSTGSFASVTRGSSRAAGVVGTPAVACGGALGRGCRGRGFGSAVQRGARG